MLSSSFYPKLVRHQKLASETDEFCALEVNPRPITNLLGCGAFQLLRQLLKSVLKLATVNGVSPCGKKNLFYVAQAQEHVVKCIAIAVYDVNITISPIYLSNSLDASFTASLSCDVRSFFLIDSEDETAVVGFLW